MNPQQIQFKQCRKCKRTLPITEFFKRKENSDGLQFVCKECTKSSRYSNCGVCGKYKLIPYKDMCGSCHNKWLKLNNPDLYAARLQRSKELRRKLTGNVDYRKSKYCSQFLGIHVAEQILSKVFNNVETMPLHNHGYDFICNHGKKIDVKSSCAEKEFNSWKFNIRRNTIADYFMCLAFDNRDDLTPQHLWLIPGKVIHHMVGLTISKSTTSKWDDYKLDINKVIKCCDSQKQ